MEPWPHNTGTPVTAGCSAPALLLGDVYTEQQVQTAYGVGALRAHASGTPVITIMDLGGGWLPSDLKLAGECFGYSPPRVDQTQGNGVPTAIATPTLRHRWICRPRPRWPPGRSSGWCRPPPGGGGILDGFSRALVDPDGIPDVISLSYGGCALAENSAAPAFTATVDGVLAMAALAGVSSFVAAGDSGSTICGPGVGGTTLSYPAVSPFVTAMGGTRLTLGRGNARVSETVWNDSAYGVKAAGGGALSRKELRPPYQDGFVPQNHRAVPDVSALADIMPGWPDVLAGTLQAVGGTSGSTPFIAAATALVDGSQRAAGHPRIGWRTDGSTRPYPVPGRSTTSLPATTTSPESDAARPLSATTSPAASASRTGPCCPSHSRRPANNGSLRKRPATGQPLRPEPDLVEGHGAPVAGRGLALEADLVP